MTVLVDNTHKLTTETWNEFFYHFSVPDICTLNYVYSSNTYYQHWNFSAISCINLFASYSWAAIAIANSGEAGKAVPEKPAAPLQNEQLSTAEMEWRIKLLQENR